MRLPRDLSKLKRYLISEIPIGAKIVNLGVLLEKEEQPTQYRLVIDRMDEKQVVKFNKKTVLITK
ncbi:hypothetical protein ACVWYN_003231 [Pedobacter sp. UYP24]